MNSNKIKIRRGGITSKKTLKIVLECDKKMQPLTHYRKIYKTEMWKVVLNLRKLEYAINKKHFFSKIIRQWIYIRHRRKYGIWVYPNQCGSGLAFRHFPGIFINKEAKLGCNCLIHQGVTIGENGKVPGCPVIGDNVFIGANAILIGPISIGDNVVIGAGSVVTKDVPSNTTVIGKKAEFIYQKEI